MDPVEALRRKLRGLMAVAEDPAATDHERANATRLTRGLKAKLKEQGVPEGDWTDKVFRAGRAIRQIDKSTAPAAPLAGTSRVAFRLGKALRHGIKKWDQS